MNVTTIHNKKNKSQKNIYSISYFYKAQNQAKLSNIQIYKEKLKRKAKQDKLKI